MNEFKFSSFIDFHADLLTIIWTPAVATCFVSSRNLGEHAEMPVAFQITLFHRIELIDPLFSKLSEQLILTDELLVQVFLYNLPVVDQQQRLRLKDASP